MDFLLEQLESVLRIMRPLAGEVVKGNGVPASLQLPAVSPPNKESSGADTPASTKLHNSAHGSQLGGRKRPREAVGLLSYSANCSQYAVKSKSWPIESMLRSSTRPGPNNKLDYSLCQLRQAALTGSRRALCALGKRFFTGRSVPASPQAAEELFRLGAQQGHVPSMFYLASMWIAQSPSGSVPYLRGLGLMQAAADCGHPRAAHQAALLHSRRRIPPRCPISAAKLLHQSLADGYPPAASALGALYESGVGVPANAATARQLYEAATKHGIKDAIGALGAVLDSADSTPTDRHRASSLFFAGAGSGDLDCAYSLGVMYATGSAGGQPNLQKAIRWLQPAADTGDAAAQNATGNILGDPESPLRDDVLAVQWYKKAAVQGHAEAQNNLAWMYEHGHGCDMDMQAAVLWYSASARSGHADAVYNLASMYIEGDRVPADDAKAVQLLLPLAQTGDITAGYLLGGRLAEAPPPVRNEQEAVRWYIVAAEGGHAGAACALGVMHQLGRGTPVSAAAAARWYTVARDMGDEDAAHNLVQLRQRNKRSRQETEDEDENEKDDAVLAQ